MSLSDLIKKAVTNTQQAAPSNNQSAFQHDPRNSKATTNATQPSGGKSTHNAAVGKSYVKSDKTARLLGDMIRHGSETQVWKSSYHSFFYRIAVI
jgi:hypothetical protein